MKKCNWLEIVAVRHGNAIKEEKVGTDQVRILSPKGIEQALARKLSLEHITRHTMMCVSSVANRAVQTGEIVFGLPVVTLPELYLPTNEQDRVSCDMQFAYLAYASLRKYIETDRTGWLLRYGLTAVEAIRKAVLQGIGPRPGALKTIGFAGHAALTPLILSLMFPQYAEVLQDIQLGEAEALVANENELVHYGEKITTY